MTGSSVIIANGTVTRVATGFVIGNLQKPIATGGPNVTFEVGNGTTYSPAATVFTGVAVAGNLTVSASTPDHPTCHLGYRYGQEREPLLDARFGRRPDIHQLQPDVHIRRGRCRRWRCNSLFHSPALRRRLERDDDWDQDRHHNPSDRGHGLRRLCDRPGQGQPDDHCHHSRSGIRGLRHDLQCGRHGEFRSSCRHHHDRRLLGERKRIGDIDDAASGTTACVVHYNQAGNGRNAAPEVTSTTTAIKANQTITVTTSAPASAVFGQTFSVAATASSGLTVAITTTGGCSGSGTGSASNTTMTSSTTSCVVHYNQAGDANYNAAPQVTSTTTAAKANTTTSITSDLPDPSVVGESVTIAFTVTANAPGAGTPSGTVTVSDADSLQILYRDGCSGFLPDHLRGSRHTSPDRNVRERRELQWLCEHTCHSPCGGQGQYRDYDQQRPARSVGRW